MMMMPNTGPADDFFGGNGWGNNGYNGWGNNGWGNNGNNGNNSWGPWRRGWWWFTAWVESQNA